MSDPKVLDSAAAEYIRVHSEVTIRLASCSMDVRDTVFFLAEIGSPGEIPGHRVWERCQRRILTALDTG